MFHCCSYVFAKRPVSQGYDGGRKDANVKKQTQNGMRTLYFCVCMSVCLCVHMCVHIYAYVYTNTLVCMQVFLYSKAMNT